MCDYFGDRPPAIAACFLPKDFSRLHNGSADLFFFCCFPYKDRRRVVPRFVSGKSSLLPGSSFSKFSNGRSQEKRICVSLEYFFSSRGLVSAVSFLRLVETYSGATFIKMR